MSENTLSWDEIKEFCNASPLEALNYYIVYPEQLIKDAKEQNYIPINYFMQVYQSAIDYYNQKFS